MIEKHSAINLISYSGEDYSITLSDFNVTFLKEDENPIFSISLLFCFLQLCNAVYKKTRYIYIYIYIYIYMNIYIYMCVCVCVCV